jgi:CRISPR-associated protein Csy1
MNDLNKITEYIEDRKARYIKKELAKKDSVEAEVLDAADKKFDYNEWIPDAARRAKSYAIVTHNCKYTHGLSNTSKIKYSAPISEDKKTAGFLISGQFEVEEDAYGGAATMDVYKFLMLIMSDGRTLLDNLIDDTDIAREVIDVHDVPYETLREQFLLMTKDAEGEEYTDGRVKQVIFPTVDSYRVFSTLTPSGLISELKSRVDSIRFLENESEKEARGKRKKGQYSENEYYTIPEVTVMGYGGTQPQNIGILNQKNNGRSYLLHCDLPQIKWNKIRLPKKNLFQLLNADKRAKELFAVLQKQTEIYYSNKNINDARKDVILVINEFVFDNVFSIRAADPYWSDDEAYINLPMHQKIFLDDQYGTEDREDPQAQRLFVNDIVEWILFNIKGGVIDKDMLRPEIRKIIDKSFTEII